MHSYQYFVEYLQSLENSAKKLRKTFELRSNEEVFSAVWIDIELSSIREHLDIIWHHLNACRCQDTDEVDR